MVWQYKRAIWPLNERSQSGPFIARESFYRSFVGCAMESDVGDVTQPTLELSIEVVIVDKVPGASKRPLSN